MPVLPKVLSAALLATLLLVGCTGGGADESTASSDAAGGSSSEGAAAVPGEDTASGGGTAAQPAALLALPAAGDAVIRTADLEVRVDDVTAAADEAARLARAAGGRVEAEDRTGTGPDGSATVQLRVPPAEFDALVAELSRLGDERSRRIGADDVSDAMVDLEARLATQRASVARVRALLEEAEALGDVVLIEGELTRRTANLEALEARLQGIEEQVALSTVVLRLDSEGGPVVGTALGFGDGLRSGWAAVTTAARLVAVTAGAVLPFLPVLLVVGYLVVRSRRARPVA